mgnify:CR=1 FL=1
MVAPKVASEAKLTSLLHGRRMLCPHCRKWDHIEAFTRLQDPPNEYKSLTNPVVKHGGTNGCKWVFSPIIR